MFTHGQLYVALSRSGVPDNTKILMCNIDGRQGKIRGREGYYTVNVVYQEVLSHIGLCNALAYYMLNTHICITYCVTNTL